MIANFTKGSNCLSKSRMKGHWIRLSPCELSLTLNYYMKGRARCKTLAFARKKMKVFAIHCARFIWNPTIFNIIRWLTGSMGQMTHRTSLWCSKYFFKLVFHKFLAKFLAKIISIDFFYKFTKIKIKSFECPKSRRNYKKMLGTSDA